MKNSYSFTDWTFRLSNCDNDHRCGIRTNDDRSERNLWNSYIYLQCTDRFSVLKNTRKDLLNRIVLQNNTANITVM